MDIHLARLAIWHTAWVLDQGHRASNESSMSRVICSEAIARVADRSLFITNAFICGSTSLGWVSYVLRHANRFATLSSIAWQQ